MGLKLGAGLNLGASAHTMLILLSLWGLSFASEDKPSGDLTPFDDALTDLGESLVPVANYGKTTGPSRWAVIAQLHSIPNSTVPQDCKFSQWSAWGACSVTCGAGTWTRTRTVTAVAVGAGTCEGALSEKNPCDSQPECPVDCKMGDWGDWSTCLNQMGSCGMEGLQVSRKPFCVHLICCGRCESDLF